MSLRLNLNFMNGAAAAAMWLAVTGGLSSQPAQAQEIGPSSYQSQADSPFNPASFDWFYLEDVEDGLINTPGLTATGPGICVAGTDCFVGSGLIDSVGNGGDGNVGHSIWADGSVTITFDKNVLGSLPTAAGLVWTDGVNPITFEAFDENDVSLGILIGNHADNSFTGGTDEDRFYGATNSGGISKLVISDPSGIEVDHVQYGGFFAALALPEPSTWAMLLLGFVMIGFKTRRRRPVRSGWRAAIR